MSTARALPQIADIRQHGAVVAVAILADDGGTRLRAVDGEGRPLAMPPTRVLHWSGVDAPADPAAAAAALGSFEDAAAGVARALELTSLWRRAQALGASASLEELAALAFDDPDGVRRGGLLRALAGDGLRFRLRGHDVQIRGVDEVARLEAERVEQQRRRGAREAVVAWLRGERAELPDGGNEIVVELRALAASTDVPSARHPTARLLSDAGREPTPAGAFEVLVERGIFTRDENLLLIRHGVGAPPADEVLRAARVLAAAPLRADAGRIDLRGLRVISIDDAGTTEVDDALSVEQLAGGALRVAVHLADPSARIPADDLVAHDAAWRQTTLYLADGVRPMLPAPLGGDVCSLRRGEDRPALTVRFTVDAEGRAQGTELLRSTVRVAEALTYDEADALLARTGDEALDTLARLASARRAERIAAGALETTVREVQPVVGPRGVALQVIDPASPARRLVAEWMVAANAAAAEYAVREKLPMPFRHQALRRPLPELADPSDPHEVYEATRCLGQTLFDAAPHPHAGLGLPAYVQITSPLRRYLDWVGQRQLVARLAGEAPPLDRELMLAAVKDAERVLGRARMVSAGTRDFWLLRWLEARREQTIPAVVLGLRARGRVQLELVPLRLRRGWQPPRPLAPGERVELRITEVDARAGRLRFALADDQ